MAHKMTSVRGWAVVDGNWSQFRYAATTRAKACDQWAEAHGGSPEGYDRLAAGLKGKTLRCARVKMEEI